MPSTVNDFALDVKKITPEYTVIYTNPTSYPTYNYIQSDNIFQWTVTLNNTGKTVKTNYVVCIVWDTKTVYNNSQCAANLCDLRVFDSDGTTEIPFYVQAPNTSYTSVFVKVPSIAAASKNIFFRTGNPAFPSKSDRATTLGATFDTIESRSATIWQMGNNANRVVGGGRTDGEVMYTWQNLGPKCPYPLKKALNFVEPTDPSNPVFKEAVQNGQPGIRFDGNDYLTFLNSTTYQNNAYTYFAVAKATVTGSNTVFGKNDVSITTGGRRKMQLLLDNATGYWRSGTDANSVSFSIAPLAWNLVGIYDYIGGSASSRQFFVNGTTTSNSTTLDYTSNGQNIVIGQGFTTATENFVGDIAEILIFPNTNSWDFTNANMQNIITYLNAKYRIYNTSDMPTVSIGSVTTNAGVEHYGTSWAPMVSFTTNTELVNGLFGYGRGQATVRVQKMLEKTVASGTNAEDWNASTQFQDDDTGQLVASNINRKLTISTTLVADTVSIPAIDGGVNYNELGSWPIPNELANATSYGSSVYDYITFDLITSNAATFDAPNSYIAFFNSAGTGYAIAYLNKNINTLTSNQNCVVKIPKNQFAFAGMTADDWLNASYYMQLGLKTTSGTQDVYYSNFKLVKNWGQDISFYKGSACELQNCVSSDNGATYYNLNTGRYIVDDRQLSGEEITLAMNSYLDDIRGKQFKELAAFPEGFLVFSTNSEIAGVNKKIQYYTYYLKKVLGLILPNYHYDVDLNLISPDDTTTIKGSYFSNVDDAVPNLNYFVIREFDYVGDIIDRLLKPVFGTLAYSPTDDKFVARNAYKSCTKAAGLLPSAVQIDSINITEDGYKRDYLDQDLIFNYAQLSAFQDTLDIGGNTILGFGDGNYMLAPGTSTTLEFDETRFRGDYNYVQPITNFHVDGYQCAPDPTSTSFNNTDISITDVFYKNKVIYITFYNAGTVAKYLRAMNVFADVVGFHKYRGVYQIKSSNISDEPCDMYITDSNSVGKYRRKQIDLDPYFTYMTADPTGYSNAPRMYVDLLSTYAYPREVIQVNINYTPFIRLGGLVNIKNRDDQTITGLIIKLEHVSEGEEMTQTLTVVDVTS